MGKTVKFFTLGCKVNQYDTQSLKERILHDQDFREVKNSLKADVYVINTCTVTAEADRKSRYLIHYAHRHNPKAKIFVTGCYAELDSGKIRNIPGVTQVLKRNDVADILNASPGISGFSGRTRAFLKIQDGCNNYCAYCKVPLVRGASRSRPLKIIKQEAKELVKRGFKEICLCGICLGAFGRDLLPNKDLVALINELEDIEGLFRIRLSSIEAGDVTGELIAKIARSGKLCRHLHIPIQSGDDIILAKMRRSYRRRDYLALIKRIRKQIPDIAITTDVMVGFPGEKDGNFKQTLELIRKIAPLRVHIFPYSRRQGTAASRLKEMVSSEEIKERIAKLRRVSAECALRYKAQFIGKEMEVLIEERLKGNSWQGHTGNYIKVTVESNRNLKNQVVLGKVK